MGSEEERWDWRLETGGGTGELGGWEGQIEKTYSRERKDRGRGGKTTMVQNWVAGRNCK